ncbi:MAG: hypothetical protein KAS32_12940 [Candidatus Peribacteraceae bacterium]|nr:hypothetical protein [Candidatus Peribacteraceae bacterium]
MGTNYYVKEEECICCGHTPEQKHIGLSSLGWTFHFRGYRGDIESWSDWKDYLQRKTIVDEYDREVPLHYLIELVEVKKDGRNHAGEISDDGYSRLDTEGHSFTFAEFS